MEKIIMVSFNDSIHLLLESGVVLNLSDPLFASIARFLPQGRVDIKQGKSKETPLLTFPTFCMKFYDSGGELVYTDTHILRPLGIWERRNTPVLVRGGKQNIYAFGKDELGDALYPVGGTDGRIYDGALSNNHALACRTARVRLQLPQFPSPANCLVFNPGYSVAVLR